MSDAGFAYKQTNTTDEENYTRELVRFMDGKVKYDLKFENLKKIGKLNTCTVAKPK